MQETSGLSKNSYSVDLIDIKNKTLAKTFTKTLANLVENTYNKRGEGL